MKIYLIYKRFFDEYGDKRKVGGIETYMEALSNLFYKKNIETIICQLSKKSFNKKMDKYEVWGIKTNSVRELCKKISCNIKQEDIVVFMSEDFCIKFNKCKTINIQHGTYYDNPYSKGNILIKLIKRIILILRSLIYYNRCKYHVAVDYNFYNFYKIFILNRLPQNLFIVPNFANKIISDDELKNKISSIKEPIKIIFARRFIKYRGSLLFARTILKLLKKYNKLQIIFAGEGIYEQEIKSILKDYKEQILFIKYLPEESFSIHKNCHIAVVPTISCEGTSLSLLEAMASGCLAIATPIGGMTNIILDGFNGLFAMPNEESLLDSLEKAIKFVESGEIQKNAVLSIRKSFSLDKWENKWWSIINFVINDKC